MRHADEEQASFHMPGHKGWDFFEREGYGDLFRRFPNLDITEIPGADNLFKAEGIIKNLMNRYRRYYGAEKSYLLINGSSAGIVASIMAVIKPGERLIMDRSSHKSVTNGLALAGGEPVYIYPEFMREYGLPGEMKVETVKEALDKNPDARAVFITSPNYYGVCSDIEAISEVVHSRGKVLIVDQAHGAHLNLFCDTGMISSGVMDAERSGADIVINSIHKTMASFTQTAVLNVCTGTVSGSKIRDALQMVQSSSPSYLMMLSLELNMDIAEKNGKKLAERWIENSFNFREQAEKIEGLKIMNHPRLDPSKLNLDMSELGISGMELAKRLMDRGIYTEMDRGCVCLAMTGIGNRDEDYNLLLEALREIAEEGRIEDSCDVTKMPYSIQDSGMGNLSGAQDFAAGYAEEWEKVHWSFATGRTSARPVVPYPPGIPLIVRGEIIDRKVLEYAVSLVESGCKVSGMDGNGFLYCYKK